MKRRFTAALLLVGLLTGTGLSTGCGGTVLVGGPGEEYFLDFNVAPDPYVRPFIFDFLYFRDYDDDDLEDFFDDLEDIFDD